MTTLSQLILIMFEFTFRCFECTEAVPVQRTAQNKITNASCFFGQLAWR